jgi:O-methyltransferase.
MGMFNLASRLAPKIVQEVDLTGRKHLLDLGGGPGTYAIHFCRRYEGLRATVFDLKTTRPFARKTIRRFGMEDRIAFRAGNYLDDDLGEGYDAAWLSHILHGEGRKIAGRSSPGRRRPWSREVFWSSTSSS